MNCKIGKYLFLYIICVYLAITLPCQFIEDKDILHIKKRSEKVSNAVRYGILQKKNYTLTPPLADLKIPQKTPKKLACYYVWEHMKNGSLFPNDIDPMLCTHILLGFSTVVNSVLVPSRPNDIKAYKWVVSLKSLNPKLKVMLSAGGGHCFSEAVSEKNRTKFIHSIFKLLNKYNFDGIDIDWEFPAWGGLPAMDKINFVQFLKEFHLENKYKYLLSVAVASAKTIIDVSYDIPNIAKYVDFINLMSYDYHDFSWYMPFTGHNSPLFRRSIETGYFATLNTAWSAQYFVEKGLPRSKLLVGIPMYSHSYKLADPHFYGFDAPAVGTGLGEFAYPQVCNFLKGGGNRVFDKESQVPYAYKNTDWIAYDDYQSVSAKAQWIKKLDFGGIMTYDLNCDDWKGTCDGKTKFPLHKIIRNILCDNATTCD